MIMNVDCLRWDAWHNWQTAVVSANLIVAHNWSGVQNSVGGRVADRDENPTRLWLNGRSTDTNIVAFIEAAARNVTVARSGLGSVEIGVKVLHKAAVEHGNVKCGWLAGRLFKIESVRLLFSKLSLH